MYLELPWNINATAAAVPVSKLTGEQGFHSVRGTLSQLKMATPTQSVPIPSRRCVRVRHTKDATPAGRAGRGSQNAEEARGCVRAALKRTLRALTH